MAEKIKYGLLGTNEVTREDDGSIEMLAIVQASGLFAGAPPVECRVQDLMPVSEEEFMKRWCAKLNRKTDLPYYLTRVRIKHVGELIKITDEDLKKDNLEPLTDTDD